MYQSEIDRRSAEAEAAARRMDPHGQIITPADVKAVEAWRAGLKKVKIIIDLNWDL